jgi:acetylserotonin N-methyltransferase
MNLPDTTLVFDLIQAFRRSKTMFAAVSLGITDRLHAAPSNAPDLAAVLHADPHGMEQLLDACAAIGLIVKQDGVYSNTPAAEAYLYSGSPYSLCGYIRYSNLAMYSLWGNLEDAVREGTHRWKQTFGWDGPIFDHFFHTPELMREFMMAMHGYGVLASPKVVAAFDLGRFRKLVDLGGGTGHLTVAACERYPELRSVVFDLAGPVGLAREFVAQSAAAGRIDTVVGDFFEDELPDADLYALSRILHDWTEEKIHRLLCRLHARLPSGGAVLVAEKLLNDDGVGPVEANMQSLSMLVLTEGRERTIAGYARLFESAGFVQVEGRRTGGYLDALLAVKP